MEESDWRNLVDDLRYQLGAARRELDETRGSLYDTEARLRTAQRELDEMRRARARSYDLQMELNSGNGG